MTIDGPASAVRRAKVRAPGNGRAEAAMRGGELRRWEPGPNPIEPLRADFASSFLDERGQRPDAEMRQAATWLEHRRSCDRIGPTRAELDALKELARNGFSIETDAKRPIGHRIRADMIQLLDIATDASLPKRVQQLAIDPLVSKPSRELQRLLHDVADGDGINARASVVLQALFEQRGKTRVEAEQLIRLQTEFGLRYVVTREGLAALWLGGQDKTAVIDRLVSALRTIGGELVDSVWMDVWAQLAVLSDSRIHPDHPFEYAEQPKDARLAHAMAKARTTEPLTAQGIRLQLRFLPELDPFGGSLPEQQTVDQLLVDCLLKEELALNYCHSGCFERASLLADYLEAHRVRAHKVFVMDARSTPNQKLRTLDDSRTSWRIHVAVLTLVQTEHGPEAMVLDPLYDEQAAIPFDQWLLRFGRGDLTVDIGSKARSAPPGMYATSSEPGVEFESDRQRLRDFSILGALYAAPAPLLE